MIRTIETHPLGAIQKVTTPKGGQRFQVVMGGAAGDSNAVHPADTLAHARNLLGVEIKHPERLTTPKSDCPHNQPGYKQGNAKPAAKVKK